MINVAILGYVTVASGLFEVINENNYTEFYDKVSNKCRYKVKQYLGDDDTEVEVIMFSMDKTLLGKSDNTDSLVEVFR